MVLPKIESEVYSNKVYDLAYFCPSRIMNLMIDSHRIKSVV